MGKTTKTKTPPGDFKVTTPKNLLLSITSGYKYKETYQTVWPIPTYQPTVELLPQYPIRLVLCIVTVIFPFNARIPIRD